MITGCTICVELLLSYGVMDLLVREGMSRLGVLFLLRADKLVMLVRRWSIQDGCPARFFMEVPAMACIDCALGRVYRFCDNRTVFLAPASIIEPVSTALLAIPDRRDSKTGSSMEPSN